MSRLPTGTVTFLFTDIEGSTRLLQQLGDRYADALTQYRRLLRSAVQERGGQEVDTQGDASFCVFPRAGDAVAAAVAAQTALLHQPWPNEAPVRARMGLHTGDALATDTGYVGLDVHRAARMCAVGHGGQILLSDTVAALVTKDLPDGISLRDLGEHRLKDLSHPHRVFQVLAPKLKSDFPPLRSLDAHRHNLPIQLTSFIGRTQEIAEVRRLLGEARLVTLTGSGGAGKTRLALQVAAEFVDSYVDGVWLAECAAIADPALVPKTVASALGVLEQPGRDITETLVDALRPKALLLVLDNCEHLLAACRDLAAALLRRCPQVRILATSREGLGVPGETLWRVPSLPVPEDIQHLPPSELVLYDAVRLFVDRAVATAAEFTVTGENALAVAQVCQRLDGIPLAIELAAARVKVLAVDQIAARLDDRFRLLTGGSPTLLPRQQTLRATLDWSYSLLSDQERTVLRRLSVFAGGWTLEAAEAVCAGGGIEVSDILDLLTQLVDKSLVIAETQGGQARYRLLETVRRYAWERMLEAGDADAVRTRHGDVFLALAERAEPLLEGAEQGTWLNRLETEHENLRMALTWSLERGDEQAGWLAGALGPFWDVRGHLSEGRGWLERTLLTRGSATRAKVLQGAGWLAFHQSDYGSARAHLEESVALYRSTGDRRGLARSLYCLGFVRYYLDDYPEAIALAEESRLVSEALTDHRGVAASLNLLARVAWRQGEYRQAAALAAECLARYRTLGDKLGIANGLNVSGLVALFQGELERAAAHLEASISVRKELGSPLEVDTLNILGTTLGYQGDYGRATALVDEALARSRELGYRRGTAQALRQLGVLALAQGDYDRAETLLVESLGLLRALREPWFVAWCLEALASVAGARGQPGRTARLLGAAEALRQAIGAPLPPLFRTRLGDDAAAARATLGDALFEAARAEGRAMTLDQAIEYAQNVRNDDGPG